MYLLCVKRRQGIAFRERSERLQGQKVVDPIQSHTSNRGVGIVRGQPGTNGYQYYNKQSRHDSSAHYSQEAPAPASILYIAYPPFTHRTPRLRHFFNIYTLFPLAIQWQNCGHQVLAYYKLRTGFTRRCYSRRRFYGGGNYTGFLHHPYPLPFKNSENHPPRKDSFNPAPPPFLLIP